jgi:hypothetical protein
MQHRLSWETSNHEIFRPLWKPQDHYSVPVAFRSLAVTMDSQARQFEAKFKGFGGRFCLHLQEHNANQYRSALNSGPWRMSLVDVPNLAFFKENTSFTWRFWYSNTSRSIISCLILRKSCLLLYCSHEAAVVLPSVTVAKETEWRQGCACMWHECHVRYLAPIAIFCALSLKDSSFLEHDVVQLGK